MQQKNDQTINDNRGYWRAKLLLTELNYIKLYQIISNYIKTSEAGGRILCKGGERTNRAEAFDGSRDAAASQEFYTTSNPDIPQTNQTPISPKLTNQTQR